MVGDVFFPFAKEILLTEPGESFILVSPTTDFEREVENAF